MGRPNQQLMGPKVGNCGHCGNEVTKWHVWLCSHCHIRLCGNCAVNRGAGDNCPIEEYEAPLE